MNKILLAFAAFNSVLLIIIIKQNLDIMAKQDQVNSIVSELNDATNALAAKIEKLIEGQNPGDPVTQESLDSLQSIADNLKAMGADDSNPIPTPEPGTGDTGDTTGGGTEPGTV